MKSTTQITAMMRIWRTLAENPSSLFKLSVLARKAKIDETTAKHYLDYMTRKGVPIYEEDVSSHAEYGRAWEESDEKIEERLRSEEYCIW
jgi:response regulator of citrate/malate metabolism